MDHTCDVCFHRFISCGKYRSLNTLWSAAQSVFVASGCPRYYVKAPSFNIRGKIGNALGSVSSLKFLYNYKELHQSCASSEEVPANFIGVNQPSFEAKSVAGAAGD